MTGTQRTGEFIFASICDLKVNTTTITKKKNNTHTWEKRWVLEICSLHVWMHAFSPSRPGVPKLQTTQRGSVAAMMESDSGEICQVTGSSWRGTSITGCQCIFIPAWGRKWCVVPQNNSQAVSGLFYSTTKPGNVFPALFAYCWRHFISAQCATSTPRLKKGAIERKTEREWGR